MLAAGIGRGHPVDAVRRPCSFSIAMICSSLNLHRFIVRLLGLERILSQTEGECGALVNSEGAEIRGQRFVESLVQGHVDDP